MNKLIFANLLHRPLRSLISILAVAIEVIMILGIVGIFMGILNDQKTRTNGIGADLIMRGSNASKKAYFYNKNGSLSILKIDGKKVTKTQDIEVGGLPEAVVFTPDGNYVLAGNFLTEDFSILKVDGTKVTDTGKRFKVPGHPASARMGH